MNPNDYTKPSGKLIEDKKAIGTFYPFIPEKLPPKIEYDDELVSLLSEADSKFNKLNGAGLNLPNPFILMLPYIKKEAVVSSKIEGTQASLTDLFLYELTDKEPKDERLGLKEVSNYVTAMEKSLALIKRGKWKRQPVNLDLLKSAHIILMQGVRGQEENPGIFRTTQNAIVPYKNCAPEKVLFFPPPPNSLNGLLQDLELFILYPPNNIPLLIQIALIHYQFECIHPFEDGNGRIGRLLIMLYLCKQAKIEYPLLYLSAYFESREEEYKLKLREVSQKSEWKEWIVFFLKGISLQSDEALKSVEKLIKLRADYNDLLRKQKTNKNVRQLVEVLFKNPYIDANTASEYLKVSHQTGISCIRKLESLGILKIYLERKRNILYKAVDILSILGV
jgi:Fic family protein